MRALTEEKAAVVNKFQTDKKAVADAHRTQLTALRDEVCYARSSISSHPSQLEARVRDRDERLAALAKEKVRRIIADAVSDGCIRMWLRWPLSS